MLEAMFYGLVVSNSFLSMRVENEQEPKTCEILPRKKKQEDITKEDKPGI